MPFLGRSLLAIGGLFLSHACYSAHEYTHVLSSSASTSAPRTNGTASIPGVRLPAFAAPTPAITISNLPTDITIEVLVSLFLLTLGIVISSEPLKPIRWSEWAARVEHGEHGPEGKYVKKAGGTEELTTEELGQQLYGGPTQEGFGYLENGRRMGFIDIRAKRKAFADQVRKGGEKE